MSVYELPEASFWRQAYTPGRFPQLQGDVETDVVIIGAGITGLTAAYLLKRSGKRVVVLEKDTVGGGTTGRTTGKVTSQHNLLYADFAKRLGTETARTYGEINQAALMTISDIIEREKIDCSWQRDDNYVYTAEAKRLKDFKNEAEVAARLGLPASFVSDTPLPFDVAGAVKFSDQGKFHSQEYVLGLAALVAGGDCHVFEHSNVVSIRDSSPASVRTKTGKVTARDIIVATNVPTLPLAARGGCCIYEYPTESYIVAGRLPEKLSGMYISPDKHNYSILPFHHGEESYLLIGGEGHLSGASFGKDRRYKKLADYAATEFGMEDIGWRWSDRDYLSYDGPPLAGKVYPWSKHLYMASAFRKWGLTNGTASAMIIHDLILGVPNKAADVFDPHRLSAVASIPRAAIRQVLGS